MSTIDLDRGILETFGRMEEGREYLFQEEAWNQIMAERQARCGYAPLDRATYVLRRQQHRLMLNQTLVWDFGSKPNPTALAFAFAFAALAFTTFALAFAAGGISPSGCPDAQPDHDIQAFSWSNLCAIRALEGNPDGFWLEENIQASRLAGYLEPNGQITLSLHGLDPDKAAQILALLRHS